MMRNLALLFCCAALVACNGDRPSTGVTSRNVDGVDDSTLPAPSAYAGSITGMPDTPPPPPATPVTDPTQVAVDPATLPPGGEPGLEDGMAETPEWATDVEPGTDAAVQVIRDYYAAINRRDYASAYRLWRGSGQASGQSAAQFAAGFSDTSGVSVEIGEPGRIDAGAGQRHVEVPVSLTARHFDGSEQRFRGRYVLQRTVVDGAHADQRAWRISNANLGEVR